MKWTHFQRSVGEVSNIYNNGYTEITTRKCERRGRHHLLVMLQGSREGAPGPGRSVLPWRPLPALPWAVLDTAL